MSKKRFNSTQIFEGLYVYLDKKNSPFYQIRIRFPDQKRHIVRSSKTESLVEAKHLAKELWKSISSSNNNTKKTPTNLQLSTWCRKYILFLETSNPSKDYRTEYNRLLSDETGLCKLYGDLEITEFNNLVVLKYFGSRENDELTNNTKNKYISLFRSFTKFCFNNGVIPTIPEIPTLKMSKRDNPRPSFTFQGSGNEWDKITSFVRSSIKNQNVIVRYNPINEELQKSLFLIVHGFIRPVRTELMSLKWEDVKFTKTDEIRTVELRVKDGKTGFRFTSSTPFLYDYLKKIKNTNPKDYVIYSDYENRTTALRMIQDQFKEVLKLTELTKDEFEQKRTLYSLRHLGIQMRLVNSKGKINIYFLAKNCGTSVEMIERFYAKYLPNSDEVIKNLQTFG